jgi:hypothetical protein
VLFPSSFELSFYRVSYVLGGQFDASLGAQLVLSIAVGLLAFGLLALIPVRRSTGSDCSGPRSATRPRHAGYRLWFEHKNLGVVVLLACCLLPARLPLAAPAVDLIGTLFMRLWG